MTVPEAKHCFQLYIIIKSLFIHYVVSVYRYSKPLIITLKFGSAKGKIISLWDYFWLRREQFTDYWGANNGFGLSGVKSPNQSILVYDCEGSRLMRSKSQSLLSYYICKETKYTILDVWTYWRGKKVRRERNFFKISYYVVRIWYTNEWKAEAMVCVREGSVWK